MSPAIFEDVGSRGITMPADILAIAANCCRYITRLNSQVLHEVDESLSVAILALFIINGEILRHDTAGRDIGSKTIFKCLKSEKLQIHPPIQTQEMVFVKNCRFPFVTVTKRGIATKGVLSRVDRQITVIPTASELDLYWESHDPTDTDMLNADEIRLLQALARELVEDGYAELAGCLMEFSKRKRNCAASQFWAADHFQIIMAKHVCRAIAEDRPLWLARVHIPGVETPHLGVFVPDSPLDGPPDTFAFTSVGSNNEYKDRGATLMRKNVRCAFLEVEYRPIAKIVPKKWMNGLCFFNDEDHTRHLVVPWPEWMR